MKNNIEQELINEIVSFNYEFGEELLKHVFIKITGFKAWNNDNKLWQLAVVTNKLKPKYDAERE